jgi:hypothetical protein
MLFFAPWPGWSQKTIIRALPEDHELAGWKRVRSIQHFIGEALYEYIDGGAEIYHEYGFGEVAVQDYVNEAEKSVSVEIFLMSSPASAYGMYTFKTDAKGKRMAIGTEAKLADYYLNFWKGPYIVTLTGFDETEETRQGLLAIAHKVASRLEGNGERPGIVSLLPEEGLMALSLKYFTGILGLRNSHPFFGLNIPGFEQGVKGDYAGGFSLFLFRFAGEDGSSSGVQSIKGQKDRRGRRFFAAAHREYMMLVMGEVDRPRADKIFDRVRQNLQARLTPSAEWE